MWVVTGLRSVDSSALKVKNVPLPGSVVKALSWTCVGAPTGCNRPVTQRGTPRIIPEYDSVMYGWLGRAITGMF